MNLSRTNCVLPLWVIPSTIANIKKNKLIATLEENEAVIELERLEDDYTTGNSSLVLTQYGFGWVVTEELVWLRDQYKIIAAIENLEEDAILLTSLRQAT